MLFLCLNLENRNYPHLDCGAKISKEKKNGRGSPSALTLGFALQRIERKPGGSRSGCIEPQPSSLFI